MSAGQPPSQPPPAIPERPDVRPSPRIPGPAVVKMLAGFGVALVVALVLPRVGGGGTGAPPTVLLVSTGALIAAATMVALWFAVRNDLGLPQRTAVFAVCYMGLVILVKFVLAPAGVYEVAQRVTLQIYVPFNQPVGAALASGVVLLRYVGVYALIYRPFRRRVVASDPAKRRKVLVAGVAFPAIAVALLMAGTGGAFLVLPLLFLAGGTEYLGVVFSSSVALLVVVALVGACALAAAAFKSAADRAQLVGDASILVSFFWLGLFFLVLFHVLWVVYMLVVFSLWPLKVVVPK